MKINKKRDKKNKGITLNSLVITVIVMIILAGVSINIVVNGDIFNYAEKAAEDTNNAIEKEKYELAKIEDIIKQNGELVNQVTDAKPGVLEGTGTQNDPYVINSIEDLVFFAYDVTQGNNYQDKIVKLGLNLDFNSIKSYVEAFRTDYGKYGYNGELKTLLTTENGFIPIGTTYDSNISTNYFCGVFDGDYKVIYNLYQNFEDSDNTSIIGFFSTNGGTIKNLIIENADMNSKTSNMHIVSGIVAGRNIGNIVNCGVSGKSKVIDKGIKSIYCAGITGQTMGEDGVVEKCFSKTNITIESSNMSQISIGGISGALTGNYIKYCYNMGNVLINTETDIRIFTGGICGINDNCIIENCYNIGNIILSANCMISKQKAIGNIVGFLSKENVQIKNCYNTGNTDINILNAADATYIGNIVGALYKGVLTNCYNIGKMNVKNITLEKVGQIVGYSHSATVETCFGVIEESTDLIGKQYNEVTTSNLDLIKKENMPSIVNVVGNEFQQDLNNTNNGYPILNWQNR